jgi:hypothetical protein
MKKLATLSTLMVGLMLGSSAFAATTVICAPSTTAGAASTVVVPANGTVGTHYMLRTITPKCSANTNVTGIDGTGGAWYAVGSNSSKGKASFRGHSNGGTVGAGANCAIPGGCTAAESATARDAANTAAAST